MNGYQVIDLKDKALSSTKVVIDGIYEAIEGNYRKPLLLTNLTIVNGDTEYELASTYCTAYVESTDFVLVLPAPSTMVQIDTDADPTVTLHTFEIKVTDDDEVTAVLK